MKFDWFLWYLAGFYDILHYYIIDSGNMVYFWILIENKCSRGNIWSPYGWVGPEIGSFYEIVLGFYDIWLGFYDISP